MTPREFAVALILPALLVFAPRPASAQFAVIVHRTNPIDSLSLEDLRRLYLGRTTTFKNQERIDLLEFTPGRKGFYRTALGMSEDQVRRHWVAVVFSGEPGTAPSEMETG